MFSFAVKRKVFISYHHGNDQKYANLIQTLSTEYQIFTDRSLDRQINSTNTDYVQWKIKEKNLTGTSVTIVLCGAETHKRKYVDWEIYHTLELKHGLVGIILPSCSLLHYNGQSYYNVPDRLSDNINSNYALWSQDWNQPLTLKKLVEQAFYNSVNNHSLINNGKTKMTRNMS